MEQMQSLQLPELTAAAAVPGDESGHLEALSHLHHQGGLEDQLTCSSGILLPY